MSRLSLLLLLLLHFCSSSLHTKEANPAAAASRFKFGFEDVRFAIRWRPRAALDGCVRTYVSTLCRTMPAIPLYQSKLFNYRVVGGKLKMEKEHQQCRVLTFFSYCQNKVNKTWQVRILSYCGFVDAVPFYSNAWTPAEQHFPALF